MCSPRRDVGSPRRVTPFGHPGIVTCWPFPLAFRRQPRPSSASGAKASSVRPSFRFFVALIPYKTRVTCGDFNAIDLPVNFQWSGRMQPGLSLLPRGTSPCRDTPLDFQEKSRFRGAFSEANVARTNSRSARDLSYVCT